MIIREHAKKLDSFAFDPQEEGPAWCLVEEGGGRSVYFHAPHTGWGNLANHSIDTKGEVNASVLIRRVHGYEDYHAFVVLDDWDPKTWKPANSRTIKEAP